MVNRSAWAGGNLNSGNVAYQLAFGNEINGIPVATPTNPNCVMSSLTFDNTTSLDEFLDISMVGTIPGASTIPIGAGLAFWMAILQGDGINYGEGNQRISAGNLAPTYVPAYPSIGGISFQQSISGSITVISGDIGGISLRPVKFGLIAQNNSGFVINPCQVWIRTYNQNLNA
jgi:hypothetical protein